MEGGRKGAGLMVTLVAATIMLQVYVAAAAKVHVVGGSTGWTIPPNSTFYSDWASSQKVAPGDTLVFNFPTGIHDVVKVPKSSYDSCTTTSQIGSTLSTGPATVTAAAGTHYYICAVTGHCSAGQKLAITVAAAAAAAATPTASRPAPAPAPAPAAAKAPAAGTPASSPAPVAAPPTAGGGPAPTEAGTGIAPAVPAVTTGASGPAAAGPTGSGANSASGVRSIVVLMAVATASVLF